MKIVNPLYDRAFKYLMQNERLAKKVIGVIINQKVHKVALRQQESVFKNEKQDFTLFRLDFNAVIEDENGKKQTVLIELQKSKFVTDLIRFRNYLGANYMKTEKVTDKHGFESTVSYPIITIYILGYNVKDIPHMAVNVDRHIVDASSNQSISVNSDFINHLTHRSHIIQVRRLPEERQSRLEKFMMLFNQAWIAENNYLLDLQDVPEEFHDIAKYLQGPVLDETFRRQLMIEDEIDEAFDFQEQKYLQQLKEAKAGEEEAKVREEEAKAREEEARVREGEAKAKIEKLAKILKDAGISVNEIE